ncbi:DUF4365 domain-containing protein [Peribacillus simplex]|uniref:DUF4365 domain-containing protein n=1 Tax=Peribacillus simplex TaxID=1478 RepID=UPI000BA7C736|nr:DUF4365 domain-containing protein [Peribacillus simplex]PAK37640.1 hypothetical protein CHI08_23125 [Peribacillus simplex]
MAKMSNGKLERTAVTAVKAEANKPDTFLIADIPEGDKGISFDGEIQVFKDEAETVESLLGKVPVQVKGTRVNSFSNKTRTFSLEIDHYRNYYNSNGVVLFVVEILVTGEVKIFYKQLLPKELKEIINYFGDIKNQKKRSVEVRALSETSLYRVCRVFINESKKQPPMLIESEAFKESDFTSFNIASLTFNPEKEDTSNIFEHDFTVYGVKEKLNVPLHLGRVHTVRREILETVDIGDNHYKLKIKITNEASKIRILIEDSLELTFNEKDQNLSYVIKRFDSLATQLKIVPFFMDMLSGQEIHFRDTSLEFVISDNDFLKELKNHLYPILLKLEIFFQNMNIDKEKKLDHINKDKDNYGNLINKIESLVDAILDRNFNRLTINEPELGKFIKLPIGDIHLIFFYNPYPEPMLVNAFSKEMLKIDARFTIEGESFPHSPFIYINEAILAFGANCQLEIIKESFDQFDPFSNEDAFNITNNFCLQCLSAFDLSKDENLLTLAESIYNKFSYSSLKEKNKFSRTVTINKLQIVIRSVGSLEDEGYIKLMELKRNSMDDIETQFCINVLIESKREAKLCFQQFDEERQKFYKTLPIYHLYMEGDS